MENKIEPVEIKEEDTQEIDFTPDELSNDQTDWKQKAQELKGIAKRRATQLKKAKTELGDYQTRLKSFEPSKEPTPKPQDKNDVIKKSEIDYAKLAFYNTKSDVTRIESDEDIGFLRQTLEDTGKPQEAILGAKWFQAELKERREAKATADAIPTGTRRSVDTSTDKVEYWVAKGGLPPNTPENVQLRRDVVNRRLEVEQRSQRFSPTPIIDGA